MQYLEVLKSQIVRVVVDNQADGLLEVAGQLDSFSNKLAQLKSGVERYDSQFQHAVGKLDASYTHLEAQHSQLEVIKRERSELARQIKVQLMCDDVMAKVKDLEPGSGVLEIEEVVRMFVEVESDGVEYAELLKPLKKSITGKLNDCFQEFASASCFFSEQEASEQETYFEFVEMSSYLRCYKLLNSKELLCHTVQDLVTEVKIADAAQLAYKNRENVFSYFNGERDKLLPLDVYF